MADDQVEPSPEIHFEPIVNLPIVETKTFEEDEDILFQMRAKLYRYDNANVTPEWKERGIGDIKILKHKINSDVRIVMRREKTLKLCANHLIQPYMILKPNSTTDRAWIWSTYADFADGESKPELLAVKFQNVENAQKFKAAFEKAKEISCQKSSLNDSGDIKNSTISSSCDDTESELNGTTDGETDTSRQGDANDSKVENTNDSVFESNENSGEKEESEVVDKLENLSIKKGNEETDINKDPAVKN